MRRFIFLAALAASAPAFAMDDAGFQKKYSAAVQLYIDSWNSKNLDALAAIYAPDGVFISATGQVLRGQEIRKFVEAEYANTEHDLVSSPTEVHRIGDAAYAFGNGSVLVGDKNLKISFNWAGAYALDGDKIAIKMLAISIPPPPPPK